jgi:hypothetical protein
MRPRGEEMIVYVVRDAAGNVRRVMSSEPIVSPGETYEAWTVDKNEE